MSQILNITMKKLTACAIFCAIIALTMAASLQCAEPRDKAEEFLAPAKSRVVKRSTDCPRGWTWISGRCFRYVPALMNWANAEINCLYMGANLASVHSSWEYREIQRLTAPYGYTEAWLGGTDAPNEGIWLWSDGSRFNYRRWCSWEPNNMFFQHCLQMNYRGSKCWDDLWCNYHRPSVCAMEI
ncbi:type-2 ice-structuring protein-like isoform X3 [Simochromis diagramma]|uniref:type-2 ice-structuring protein-like isoform X3 n=1 Tax=Simochromis diagramma TaxID=43689 RepID=UPI001A7E5948|nr:type-2 ice-structuring protein-like isoform X3 [Simochromis diagramma]